MLIGPFACNHIVLMFFFNIRKSFIVATASIEAKRRCHRVE